tara:strand:- start:1809 stop:2189 length:381 start_codon:yes stop_codon:yes gene_type:complete
MAITNKEILEAVEILKSKMPNGNIALLQQSIDDLQKSNDGVKISMRELKKQLLDPDDGVVVRVNKNSEFRRESEKRGPLCQKSFEEMEDTVQDLTDWKANVTKFIWILLTTMTGLIAKVIYDMVGK